MARAGGHQNALHRTGQSLGERLLREPEREAQGRTTERGDLHHAARSSGPDRELATPLQCHPTALLARLSPAGTRGDLAASVWSALRSPPASPDAGRARPDSNLGPGFALRGTSVPWPVITSTCRSFAMISSGLCR